MTDRASHRAAVEAGYADLAGYIAKYRDEPEYPGASIRTHRLVWPSTGELGEVRLMDYGSGSKKRYRVACFCPGRVVELPGDTPKVEPEADNWCETLADASAWLGLYVDRERRDGWKHADERPSLHGDGHVGPVSASPKDFKIVQDDHCSSPRLERRPQNALNPFDTMMIMQTARNIVSRPTPHYSYVDVGDALVSYLRGGRDAQSTMRALNDLALDYECLRGRS